MILKIFITLVAALFLGTTALASPNDEPLYRTAPHRMEAALRREEIRKYSINLMWINRTLDPSQRYLSSATDEAGLVNQLLTPALKWAVANPQADVNLWYDGVMATREAVGATQAVLDRCLRRDGVSNIRLRDVRDIPVVRRNPDAFSDGTPIYFRVDLLKPILIVHAVENEGNQAAVYADLEVGDQWPDNQRMNKGELFDEDTLNRLSVEGLLLNNDGGERKTNFSR